MTYKSIYALIINYIKHIFNRLTISIYGKYYNASALFTIVVLLLHDCEARDSQLWTNQNSECKDKEKAM